MTAPEAGAAIHWCVVVEAKETKRKDKGAFGRGLSLVFPLGMRRLLATKEHSSVLEHTRHTHTSHVHTGHVIWVGIWGSECVEMARLKVG